ncbi:MAG: plasma-membrane proton-efflux P-type ATPase [Alphaproteobacteria bacterium]
MDKEVTAKIAEQQAQTPPVKGLTHAEAETRLTKYGPNEIAEKHQSVLKKLLSYFWGPIPWMIEAAAILSGALGNWADLAIIIIMLGINAAVAFWQEHKAGDAIALLKARLAPEARVLRDGNWSQIPARELVPGDVVLLQIGNIVPADAKLIKGDYLSVDESALTGESLPVDKGLGDQAYSGAIVRQGEMTALITATGMNTYFGKTAQLVATAEVRSHFQRAVLKIGNFLILATAGLVALILLVALFRQEPFLEVLQFALILTVAAIPVALPTVLSVTMAIGAERLAQMKAIVSRLVAIEELAGVDVLCADKTGTLTKNKLTLGDPLPVEGIDADELVLAAALASNREGADAIDDAVLAGLKSQAALDDYLFVKFTPFDPVSKRTEATVQFGGKALRVSKGAAQVILDLTAPDAETRKAAEDQVDSLAQQGFRAIAVAHAENGEDWRYLGLLPIFDPPRDDAAATITETKKMGVEVKMITGDHEAIARQIASRLGLGANILSAHELFDVGESDVAGSIEAANGVARVFPEHKFQIVKTLESGNHIIGMTGDGVNDAPALKQADVGIAVSGATDAARAAADLVLTAPGLSVITSAIEEARRIFERMTSYATYRIAETIRVLLFMTLSILIFRFYPVTAIMIVMLAILNDFPIMMIAYDNAPFAAHPVRWDMRRVLTLASVLGAMGVVETFLLFWFVDTQLNLSKDVIQTVIFLKLLIAGHLTIYVTRSQRWFWSHPWPDIRLFLTCEATQVFGTLIAVYGLAVTPIGWTYALGVWAYALAWLPIESAIALGVRRLLDTEARQGSPR